MTGPDAGGGRADVLPVLVAGLLLNSIGFFAALPFLTLYLSDISRLPDAAIGAAVGSIALIAALGGYAGGIAADRFGAVTLIRAGLTLYIATYAALAAMRSVPAVIALIVLLGVGRVLVEPSMKRLLSLAAGAGHSGIFRIRYVTLCVGAVIGPLLGATLYALNNRLIFVAPAVIFAGYLASVQWQRDRLRVLDQPDQHDTIGWHDALADRQLLRIVAAGFVIFMVFAQFESILPLFIKTEHGAGAARSFSWLLMANAALGIALQAPAEWLSRRCSQQTVILVGCAAFATGLGLFGAMAVHLAFLYSGVVFWTVGEALLLPLPDMLIHDLADDDHKGAYFGLAELRYIGFFVGPAVGGALLAHNHSLYFAAAAAVVFVAAPLLTPPRGGREFPVPVLSLSEDAHV
jgi:MFS family permease